MIIGGGLAGLTAAVDLSSAGFEVIILERGNRAGGRLSAWRDQDGDTIEHGVHGWWHQYFNFFDLAERVGIPRQSFLLDPFPSSMVFEDGSRVNLRWLRRHYPTPLYLFPFLHILRRLRPADYLLGLPSLAKLFSFDHRELSRYDGVSMYAYLERFGATKRVHELVVSPFARSFGFSSTEELSAGAVMSALTFYLVEHQDDVKASWCHGNPQEYVIDPIVRYIEAHGGQLHYDTAVNALVAADNSERPRIQAATVGSGNERREIRVPLAQIPAAEPLPVDGGSHGPILLRRSDSAVVALSARCTHMGCTVAYNPEGRFDCPCHGGQFRLDGTALRAPPTRPLLRFPASVQGDEVVVELESQTQSFEADYFILATDVEAAKGILSMSPAVKRLAPMERIFNLEATEVMVARMWLDARAPADLSCGVFTGLGFLDNFFVLSNFQDEFREYDGTVLEVQMYVVRDYINLSEDDIKARITTELGRLIPEFRGAKVRKFALNRLYDVFPHFNVGSEVNRPGVRTPCPNLFIAADWIHTDEPWWMMERAVAAGRLAANEILDSVGAPRRQIHKPAADERFTRVMKAGDGLIRRALLSLQRVIGYEPLPP